jgi:hypothetical protein
MSESPVPDGGVGSVMRGMSRSTSWGTLAALTVIPMTSAVGGIIRGPQAVPGGSPDVIPTVESALRYANVFKFAAGPVIW